MPHNHSVADAQFETALELLRANHQRVTEPRKAILGILTKEHGPFTAEEVHRRMKKGSCDLVTVYRSLAAMEESSVVRRCDFGDGAYRYEINTGRPSPPSYRVPRVPHRADARRVRGRRARAHRAADGLLQGDAPAGNLRRLSAMPDRASQTTATPTKTDAYEKFADPGFNVASFPPRGTACRRLRDDRNIAHAAGFAAGHAPREWMD